MFPNTCRKQAGSFKCDPFSELHSCPPGLGVHLHSNDGVYEEKHGDQEADIRKSLREKKATIKLTIVPKHRCFEMK